eukprot:gene1588-16041_t
MKLVHYENPGSLKSDSTCCDGTDTSTGECNTCEYMFKICLSDPRAKPCSLANIFTDWVSNKDYYLFDPYIYVKPYGDALGNPLQIPFRSWNNSLLLKFVLLDDDNAGASDLISTMEKNVTINATRSGTIVQTWVVLEGERRTTGVVPKLSAQISVSCKTNYLIPSCSDYCVNTDDASGHYVCNYMTGKRDCLAGWYGDRCDKKISICNPRNDSLGHYTCEKMTGAKICLPGWRNESKNCTEEIMRTATPPNSKTRLLTVTSSYSTTETPQNSKTRLLTVTSSYSTLETSQNSKTRLLTVTSSYSATETPQNSKTMLLTVTSSYSTTATTQMSVTWMSPSSSRTLIETTEVLVHRSNTLSKNISTIFISKETSSVVPLHSTSHLHRTTSTQDLEPKSHSNFATASSTGQTISTVLGTPSRPVALTTTQGYTLIGSNKPSSMQRDMSMETQSGPDLEKATQTDSMSLVSIAASHTTQNPPVIKTASPTLRPKMEKMMDFGKLVAFIVSIGLLILLSATILLTLKMKNKRNNRIQPIKLGNRYQQNSAFSMSSRHSKATSCPSIQGLAETKIGAFLEPKMVDVDRRSANSRISQARWSSAHSSCEQQQHPQQKRAQPKGESFVSTINTPNVLLPKETYLLVPTDPYLRLQRTDYI